MFLERKALNMYASAMAGDKPRTERIPLLLTKDEIRDLDDWQFTHRMRTRSDAIRKMMRIAIELTTGRGEDESGSSTPTK